MERQTMIRPLNDPTLIPHAIGRYLVDLPEGARLMDWYQVFQGTGPIRMAREVTPDQFKKITEQRAAELNAVPHVEGGTRLEKVIIFSLPHAQAIVYWPNDWTAKERRLIECDAFYLLDGYLYRFRNSIRVDPVKQANYCRGFESMLRSIHPRRPDEIPTAPGSCFDNSILHDGPDRDYSEIVMAEAIWPDRPDVHFHFSIMDNGPNPDPPLLTRLRNKKILDGPGVLRSGNRTVGTIEGQEQLERVTSENDTESHLFIWEAQGLPNRWDMPQIRIEMTSGNGKKAPQDSSLSDEDALALWDRIIASWRWRPTKAN
jgi:hypothetical protein